MSEQADQKQNKKKTITEYFSSKPPQDKESEVEHEPMKKLKTNGLVKKAQSPIKHQDSDTDTETETSGEINCNKSSPIKQNIQLQAQTDSKQNQEKDKQTDAKQVKHEEEESKQDSSSNVKEDSNKKALRSQSQKLKNLQFYLNNMQSTPNGDYVQNMLTKWQNFISLLLDVNFIIIYSHKLTCINKRKGNFKLLEVHHGYVQWLFPNFYQSRFNSGSDPLQREEADEFIKNPQIALRLRKSYDLIYEFFGMKIVNEVTGEVQRSASYKERYQATFITSYHNHMRIRRILCHFNNVGFRRYSISLIKFLEKEIYGEKGFQKFIEDKRPIAIKWQEIPITVPLRSLSRLKVFEEWMIYGEIDETNIIHVETLQDNCFATFGDIKRESIYFQSLKK